MSVLIRGMEMPKSCDMCILAVPVFDYAKHKHVSICLPKNSNGCPLVEVPTPHGRLIDAEKFERDIHRRYCQDCDNYNGLKCRACWIDDMLGEIEDAPTVIEADNR